MKKRKVYLVIALALVVLIAGVVVYTLLNQRAEFKMKADGSLYYNGFGRLGDPAVIEIPRKFDGAAREFSNYEDLYGISFSYDGSLKEFMINHPYVFSRTYTSDDYSKKVYCSDYTLEYSADRGHWIFAWSVPIRDLKFVMFALSYMIQQEI